MPKLVLDNLVNLDNPTSVVNTINTNNNLIATALENTFSRDGTSPNSLSAPLDMNNNRIFNLPAPTANGDVVRLQDLTLTYLSDTILSATPVVGDAHKLVKVNGLGTLLAFSSVLVDASNNLVIPGSYISIQEMAAPAAPSADTMRIYCRDDATVSRLYSKNSSGTEVRLDIPPASTAQMEAGTSLDTFVAPGTQHRHPASPKAWVRASGGVSPALLAGFNVASVSRPSIGRLLVTFTTAMSSVNYCVQVTAERPATSLLVAYATATSVRNASITTTTFEVECYDSTATTVNLTDPSSWHIVVWGDQ